MEAIANWLNGTQDYKSGIELYDRFGDGSLSFLFQLPQSSFTEQKLELALTEILKKSGKITIQTVVKTKGKPEPNGNPERREVPESVVMALRDRTRSHEALFHEKSSVERFELAKRIKESTRVLDDFYDRGIMPVDVNALVEIEVPVNGWELHEVYGNNKSYISKNKNKPSKESEIKVRMDQNELIQSRLKSMNYAD